MPEALASVSNASIRGFYRLALRVIDAYSAGVRYGMKEFKKKMYINRIGRWKIGQSSKASCAPHWHPTANLLPQSRVVSPSIDNQATISTISRSGCSHLASFLRDIRNATFTMSHSGSAVQVRWTPGRSGISGNDLVDAATKLAVERPSGNFSWSFSHLRFQVLIREWQVLHKPIDDFPFPFLHKALRYLHPPSPCSYTSISDGAICLLPPRPL